MKKILMLIGLALFVAACVQVDVDSPVVRIEYPTNGTFVKATVEIVGTAYDKNFEKYILKVVNKTAVVFSYENQSVVKDGILAKWNTKGVADGSYEIKLVAYDMAGNVNEASVNVTVDNTPPMVKVLSPRETTYDTFIVEINVTSDEPVVWFYSLDDRSNVTFVPPKTITVKNGEHKLVVYAKDRAGNVGYSIINFSVNTTVSPPEVYFYYSPTCPWCKMVIPYVQQLNESGVNVVFCNVAKLSNCSSEARKIAKEVKLRGVPTAVVVVNETISKVFIGAYEVAELGKLLKEYGYRVTTNYTVGGLNYTVKDCIECHAKKKLPPPSRYTCSSCCHQV